MNRVYYTKMKEVVINYKQNEICKIPLVILQQYKEKLCFNKQYFSNIKNIKCISTNTDKMKNINGYNFEAKTDLFKLFSVINLNNIYLLNQYKFNNLCKTNNIKCKKLPDEIILSDTTMVLTFQNS